MKYNCLLFDLDGTIVDTNALVLKSFQHTYENYYGITRTEAEIYDHFGEPLRETFHKLNPDTVEEALQFYRTFNLEHHDNMVDAFPNVKATLAALKDKGYKLGVVTSKLKPSALRGLEVTGIAPYFDAVVAVEDTEEHKPHPAPVFKALELLGAKPEEAVMLGDSRYDILAAKNAGVLAIGVCWSVHCDTSLKEAKPDVMLKDFADLPELLATLK